MNAPNPNGIGGFAPGQSGNAGGRPRSQSAIQILALRFCREAMEGIVELGRKGTREDAIRLQAYREILDRGIGKPAQSMALDLTVSKRIDEMSEQELRDFSAKYQALMLASPLLIDTVIKQEEGEQPMLGIDGD
jgi:hypothetical protein